MRKEKKALLLHSRDQMTSCVAWGKREIKALLFPEIIIAVKGDEKEEKETRPEIRAWPVQFIIFPQEKGKKRQLFILKAQKSKSEQQEVATRKWVIFSEESTKEAVIIRFPYK